MAEHTNSSRSRNSQHSASTSRQSSPSASSYLTYPVSHVMSGLYRRLTEPAPEPSVPRPSLNPLSNSGVYTPPHRTASPFQPPPLTPLSLITPSNTSNPLITRSLAEEIRLLIPPRLQLVHSWQLVYSLERDGSSLATLYDKCKEFSHRSQRAGYVLVIRDASQSPVQAGNDNGLRLDSGGALFGAYLTDPPHPASHYYGTGECFLWRASILPPAPMIHVNTKNGNKSMAQNTTGGGLGGNQTLSPLQEGLESAGLPPPPVTDPATFGGRSTDIKDNNSSGTNTPELIRFKAFPYSGVNDYMIFCETGFLSVGGGDGHFGLWLDDSFEKGVSSPCLTFGNEPLSDEGTKFDVLGVEVWYIG
ncbi:oxidation resistance protein 1 [Myotisia sp. PD_48]|nr:oxidation resistance protein 1 [Myotisia sp. PD_48]